MRRREDAQVRGRLERLARDEGIKRCAGCWCALNSLRAHACQGLQARAHTGSGAQSGGVRGGEELMARRGQMIAGHGQMIAGLLASGREAMVDGSIGREMLGGDKVCMGAPKHTHHTQGDDARGLSPSARGEARLGKRRRAEVGTETGGGGAAGRGHAVRMAQDEGRCSVCAETAKCERAVKTVCGKLGLDVCVYMHSKELGDAR